MKLSKQERIAVIIIAIIVILVVGIFVFIKPNIETINATRATLDNKNKELSDAQTKAATKDSLKEQILAAYDEGKNTADMFYPELQSYEVDNEVRAFLEQCETEVLVEALSVSQPKTASLGTSVYVPTPVSYALKDYVNQGVTTDITKTDPNLIRQVLIQAALGETQTIGASTATFVIKANTREDLMAFADEVNDYVKKENGKDTRKAVSIDTLNFANEEIASEYSERAASSSGGSSGGNSAGNNNNSTPPAGETTPPANDNNNEDEDKKEYYNMAVTMTFYSIERMQDPTETLDNQDIPVGQASAT